MPFKDARSHLEDILESIDSIQQFVVGMDRESYCRDDKTQAAVERKLLILSEAAVRPKDSAEALCPGIPWRDIRGSGNWLPPSIRQRGCRDYMEHRPGWIAAS